jgi:hypothetical protein
MIVAILHDEEGYGPVQAKDARILAGQGITDGAAAEPRATPGNAALGIGRVTAIIVHHFCASHI